jgi:hypothetical protein
VQGAEIPPSARQDSWNGVGLCLSLVGSARPSSSQVHPRTLYFRNSTFAPIWHQIQLWQTKRAPSPSFTIALFASGDGPRINAKLTTPPLTPPSCSSAPALAPLALDRRRSFCRRPVSRPLPRVVAAAGAPARRLRCPPRALALFHGRRSRVRVRPNSQPCVSKPVMSLPTFSAGGRILRSSPLPAARNPLRPQTGTRTCAR